MFALRASGQRLVRRRQPVATASVTVKWEKTRTSGWSISFVRDYGAKRNGVASAGVLRQQQATTKSVASASTLVLATPDSNAFVDDVGPTMDVAKSMKTRFQDVDKASVFVQLAMTKSVASASTLASDTPDLDAFVEDGGPTMDIAKSMAISVKDMDNESLVILSSLKVKAARAEVLRRHIMTVDDVSYSEASKIFQEIEEGNNAYRIWHTLPYKIGTITAACAGFMSIPLVFHLPTVEMFNDLFVTNDVPEPKDLETWLEVGVWSWKWVGPPLGQISFFLLCLQYARSQMIDIGFMPYSAKLRSLRARRLVARYPQYDATLLKNYSKSVNYYN